MELYERYYDRLLNFLHRRTRDRDLAEDLVSKTFLRALEDLRRRPRELDFRPWIYRIAINEHLSHGRSLGRWIERMRDFVAPARETTARDDLQSAERLARVRAAAEGLPARYREPLLLRYDEELEYNEIGRILGLAEGSVRSRVSRAIDLIRRRLEESDS